tara:strand:+ start:534 stop:710 length:177 start_codon:yes stop_codon:yes gene_type:complete
MSEIDMDFSKFTIDDARKLNAFVKEKIMMKYYSWLNLERDKDRKRFGARKKARKKVTT